MTSAVKITSPNGTGQGSEVIIDGQAVKYLSGMDVSIHVGEANVVRLHMVAQVQDIEIAAEIKIGGAVIPPALELALQEYFNRKYPLAVRCISCAPSPIPAVVELTSLDGSQTLRVAEQ